MKKKLTIGSAVYDDFDGIYPEEVRPMAFTHFTPIEIAIRAAKFLVQKSGTKVLDIGSGAGKFCMIGSVCTNGHFTGVEQRGNLHLLAEQIFKKYQLKRKYFFLLFYNFFCSIKFKETPSCKSSY